MQRCLDLAIKGMAQVAPNPMVGCVIVNQDKIIGEAYHAVFGGPHAEVLAIQSVLDQSLLKEATVYVSLEPCSHFGKTPPCTELLISKQVKRIVIGCKDVNPLVAGKGVYKLQTADIDVKLGVLESACREINKRFITSYEKHRPFVILKWAETADGYMSGKTHKQLSGLTAQTLLHKWRTEEDAFFIGTETLIQDNPQLNSRLWKGKDPIRVAIDYNLRSEGLMLRFLQQGQKTIILNQKKEAQHGDIKFVKIKSKSVADILEALHNSGIQSVVVEGGPNLLNSFMKAQLFDEVRRFVSKEKFMGSGIVAPIIDTKPKQTEDLIEDMLFIY